MITSLPENEIMSGDETICQTEAIMISQHIAEIEAAEKNAALIEYNAREKAKAILSLAHKRAAESTDQSAHNTDQIIEKIIQDAERKRDAFSKEYSQETEEAVQSLCSEVANRIPAAVDAVMNLLIGKE